MVNLAQSYRGPLFDVINNLRDTLRLDLNSDENRFFIQDIRSRLDSNLKYQLQIQLQKTP